MRQYRCMTEAAAPALSADPAAMTARAREDLRLNISAHQALEAGLDGYDFLAGQARYKQQLSHQTYTTATFTLHRPSLGLRLEQAWRRIRARFTPPVSSSAPPSTPS
jgi:hypothetical protein